MKIAWFTPFCPQSAIGRVSHLVTAELARSAEVDIWHPETRNVLATPLRTISMARALRVSAATLSGYDLVVYNLGNYAPFHAKIFEASRDVPGVVVLHDFVMHHFFRGYYGEYASRLEDYTRAMETHYGRRGGEAARAALAGASPPVWETDEVAEFPLFEEAIRRAHGVIVHSEFLAERVRRVFAGPVARLFLAVEGPSGRCAISREKLGAGQAKVLMVTAGLITPPKRVLGVIETLGANPDLCRGLVYAVVGKVEPGYQELLSAAVRRYSLEDVVRFTGYAPDAEFDAWLTHADLCVNLRYPVTEGASASVIEQMLYGKPAIVTDAGSYRELPGDCVRKIDPGREREELTTALRELLADPSVRSRLGARAKRFAESNCHARQYAEGVLGLAEEILEVKPLLLATDHVAARLAEMGVDSSSPLVDYLADEMHALFCGEGKLGTPGKG